MAVQVMDAPFQVILIAARRSYRHLLDGPIGSRHPILIASGSQVARVERGHVVVAAQSEAGGGTLGRETRLTLIWRCFMKSVLWVGYEGGRWGHQNTDRHRVDLPLHTPHNPSVCLIEALHCGEHGHTAHYVV